MKMTLPAGKYFVGECSRVESAVGIPCRSGVWLTNCGEFEIEIADGGSCWYDPNDVGVLGVKRLPDDAENDDYYNCVFDMAEPFEVEMTENYFSAGPVKITVPDGYTFMNPGDEFDVL